MSVSVMLVKIVDKRFFNVQKPHRIYAYKQAQWALHRISAYKHDAHCPTLRFTRYSRTTLLWQYI